MIETNKAGSSGRQRWAALAKINALSVLSQIVQIGATTPLLSLSLEERGVEPAKIGVIISASWIAILGLYKLVPRLLKRLGMVRANVLSAVITILALIGMTLTSNLLVLFGLNFSLGIGLIIRWIACDTWIIAITSKTERGRAIGTHETLMGLGIAIGPLLIVAFGATGSTPFYVCAATVFASGCLALTLKRHDLQPSIPSDSLHYKLFKVIPIALCGAFLAGYSETSSVSFLAGYSLSVGYAFAAAVLLVSVFGMGGTVLQLPIGWLADKSSYKAAQSTCAIILLIGTITIPYSQSLPGLMAFLVFLWGGAIGGMNTLAVIEAGHRVAEQQVSVAMTTIAMFYTLGGVIGPVATGAAVSYFNTQGLMISIGVAGAVLISILMLRNEPADA